MLDAAMLGQISDGYAAAAISSEAKKLRFGGKNVVIIGDLLQLPPVSECRAVRPLYEDMVCFALHQNSSRFNQEKRLTDGLVIFENFNKFELTKQMRSKDKRHTHHIQALRTCAGQKHVCVIIYAKCVRVCVCVCVRLRPGVHRCGQ